MARYLIYIFTTALFLLSSANASPADKFLGNLTSFERTEQGILLHCENQASLEIRIYHDAVFRVTLRRKDQDMSLLEQVISDGDWEFPEFSLLVEDAFITLGTREINIIVHKMPCRLTVVDKKGMVINKDDPGLGIGWRGDRVQVWKSLAPGERFFGLGGSSGNLDLRGRQRILQNRRISDPENHSYSIPFYLGMVRETAYGIYLNNSYRSVFDFGAGNLRFASISADGGALDYFFFYGPRVDVVLTHYTRLTGRTPLPPGWALGYHHHYTGSSSNYEPQVLAEELSHRNIPFGGIHLSQSYMRGRRMFTWDDRRIGDPQKLSTALEKSGFRLLTTLIPAIRADETYSVAREGITSAHFMPYPDGEPYRGDWGFGPAFLPDFGKPGTVNWWLNHLRESMSGSVSGYFCEDNEPSGRDGAFPPEVLITRSDEKANFAEMRNLYALKMVESIYNDSLGSDSSGQRPFLISRAGFAGLQNYAAAWTGDQSAGVVDLRAAVRRMLGMSISGLPFVGSDVGGFIGQPSASVFTRWIQLGAVSPLLLNRSRTSGQLPWEYSTTIDDITSHHLRWRYRILPYIYHLFWEASESGSPIVRPLFYHFQNDSAVYNSKYQEQFMLGDHILVAPVVEADAQVRELYLPEGSWLNYHTDEVYEGKQEVAIEAPLDQLPMFLRAGAMIPMWRGSSGDSLQFDIFAVRAYSSYLLYEDDQTSFRYKQGDYRLSEFELFPGEKKKTLTKRRLENGLPEPERVIVFRFHNWSQIPKRIRLGKKKLPKISKGVAESGYSYDLERKILVIHIPDLAEEQTLTIE